MKRKTLWVKLQLSKPFLYSLGEVISQWAYFENKFDESIHFMRMDRRAEALSETVPFSLKQRIDLFSKSYKVCFSDCPELIDRFTHIKKETKKLKKTRDHITHCIWGGDSKNGSLSTYTINNNGEIDSKEITTKLLKDTSCDISALSRHVMAVVNPFFHDALIPLSPNEISFLQNFRERNHPKIPPPDPEQLRSPSSQK